MPRSVVAEVLSSRVVLVSLCLIGISGCGSDDAVVDSGFDASNRDSGSVAVLLGGTDDVFVSPQWLADHLDASSLVLLDVRARSAFMAQRIPGALYVDPATLRATVNGIDGQVLSADAFDTVMRAAGVPRDADVVVYGSGVDTSSARVVWTFEYYGFERVALLDGGFGAWTGAVDAATPAEVPPSDFGGSVANPLRGVDAEWVNARLDNARVRLVDARAANEFAAGRIPGAINVNWTDNVQAGFLKERAELSALYPPPAEVDTWVAYCQTGSRASVAYLVMRSLGFSDVRLYDGSWAEWGSREDLPREP